MSTTPVENQEPKIIAYCRTCGKGLSEQTRRELGGVVYCEQHAPLSTAAPPAPSPYNTPLVDTGASPGLAFLLGLIPGVGAVYNGQYAKGLIHVVILGLLISVMSSGAAGGLEPLFGLSTGLFYFYMAFEAYHTAKKRQLGQPVDEFSSLFPLQRGTGRFPLGPILLILVGVVFLLETMGVIRLYQMIRYWPVLLIIVGVWGLYNRIADARKAPPAPEVPYEQR